MSNISSFHEAITARGFQIEEGTIKYDNQWHLVATIDDHDEKLSGSYKAINSGFGYFNNFKDNIGIEIYTQKDGVKISNQQFINEINYIPITLEKMKNLLCQTHQTDISLDDPILMAVTMHENFIRDLVAVFNKNNQILDKMAKSIAQEQNESFKKFLSDLHHQISGPIMEMVLALVKEQGVSLERLSKIIHHHKLFIGALTLITILTSLLTVLVFYYGLR
ncbi:MAG: hypothetical protein LBS66_02265 [Rhodospirillaceae bacterium]|jgi:hypothetical protein|nr:hypothetical protein [Rhodospirillaceae bacterium]